MRAQVQELERRQALIEKAKQQELDDRGAQITKELEVLQKQMEQLSDRMRELERALRLQNGMATSLLFGLELNDPLEFEANWLKRFIFLKTRCA